MPGLILLFAVIGFWAGMFTNESDLHAKCVEKYSSMPHNAVNDHCKEILKFTKESK